MSKLIEYSYHSFKIWHYSGGLLFEHNVEPPNELWESMWQPVPDSNLKEFKISNKKVLGIKPSQPQGALLQSEYFFISVVIIFSNAWFPSSFLLVSKELYRPPGARGTSAILKFLEEREPPSNPKAAKPSTECLTTHNLFSFK